MSNILVYSSVTNSVELDSEILAEYFPDEYEDTIQAGETIEDFVREVVFNHGFDILLEGEYVLTHQDSMTDLEVYDS